MDTCAPSPWLLGARTVRQATADTGLSRQQLFLLMADGVVRYKVASDRGDRLLCWSDLVAYLEALPDRLPEPRRVPLSPGRNGAHPLPYAAYRFVELFDDLEHEHVERMRLEPFEFELAIEATGAS